MDTNQNRSGSNTRNNAVSMGIGAIVVCVAVLAMFTPRDQGLSSGRTEYTVAMATAQGVPVQAQLAFMASNPVDLGFGASIVEMNRTVAQEQGIQNSSGGYVVSVQAGSPADRAGIRTGDVINRINGR